MESKTLSDLRKDYYNMADGLAGSQTWIEDLNDKKALEYLAAIRKAQNDYFEYMQDKYTID